MFDEAKTIVETRDSLIIQIVEWSEIMLKRSKKVFDENEKRMAVKFMDLIINLEQISAFIKHFNWKTSMALFGRNERKIHFPINLINFLFPFSSSKPHFSTQKENEFHSRRFSSP